MITSSGSENLFNYACHSDGMDGRFFIISRAEQENSFSKLEIKNPSKNQLNFECEKTVWLLEKNRESLNAVFTTSIPIEINKRNNSDSADRVSFKSKLKEKFKIIKQRSSKEPITTTKNKKKLICNTINSSSENNNLNPDSKKTTRDYPKTYSDDDSFDKDQLYADSLLLKNAVLEIMGKINDEKEANTSPKAINEIVQNRNTISHSKQAKPVKFSGNTQTHILREMDTNKLFKDNTARSQENQDFPAAKHTIDYPRTYSELDTTEENLFNLNCQFVNKEVQKILNNLKITRPTIVLNEVDENHSGSFDFDSRGE